MRAPTNYEILQTHFDRKLHRRTLPLCGSWVGSVVAFNFRNSSTVWTRSRLNFEGEEFAKGKNPAKCTFACNKPFYNRLGFQALSSRDLHCGCVSCCWTSVIPLFDTRSDVCPSSCQHIQHTITSGYSREVSWIIRVLNLPCASGRRGKRPTPRWRCWHTGHEIWVRGSKSWSPELWAKLYSQPAGEENTGEDKQTSADCTVQTPLKLRREAGGLLWWSQYVRIIFPDCVFRFEVFIFTQRITAWVTYTNGTGVKAANHHYMLGIYNLSIRPLVNVDDIFCDDISTEGRTTRSQQLYLLSEDWN